MAFVIVVAPTDNAVGVIVNAPVEAPVAAVVPKINELALSSQPMNTLLSEPLSITIPASFDGVPVVPVPNSNNASSIVVLVEDTVDVAPLTVKLPDTTTSSNVTSSDVPTACPILIAPLDIATPVPADM